MGTEAMTLLRDAVAHGTQGSETAALEFPPHVITVFNLMGLQVITHELGSPTPS